MRAFYSFLNRISTIPVFIIAAIVFVCFIVYFLPMQKAATAQYSEDAGSVGLSFFPMPDTAYEWAEAYGPEGRRAFIKTWLTYDFFWPLSFTTLFLVFIGITMRYVHGAKAARLCGLALVTLVMDYLENILAIIIMSWYPTRLEVVAWGLAGVNALKWVSMGAVSVLFFYGLVALPVCFVYRKIRKV
jgi:hypothetical protein